CCSSRAIKRLYSPLGAALSALSIGASGPLSASLARSAAAAAFFSALRSRFSLTFRSRVIFAKVVCLLLVIKLLLSGPQNCGGKWPGGSRESAAGTSTVPVAGDVPVAPRRRQCALRNL